MTILESLTIFVQQVVDEQQARDADSSLEEIASEVWQKLGEMIVSRISRSIPEVNAGEFEAMLVGDDGQESIISFIEQHIEDTPNFMAEILLDFKKYWDAAKAS